MNRKLALSIAITCLLALTPAMAPGQTESDLQNRQDQNQNNQQTDGMQSAWLQQLSEKVDLSDEQRSQIQQKIQQHNEKIRSAWQEFTQAHLQTVSLEAAMYSALEENMDTRQKEQFRDNLDQNNRSNNRMDSSVAGQSSNRQKQMKETEYREDKSADEANDDNWKDRQSEADQSEKVYGNDRDQEKTYENDRDRDNAEDQNSPYRNNRVQDRNENQSDQQSRKSADYYVSTMILVPAEAAVQSAQLDGKSKQQCTETCQKFRSKLTDAWQQVHQKHRQMVKLESEKLQAIEETLNEDQLKQLRGSQDDGESEDNWNQDDNQEESYQRSDR